MNKQQAKKRLEQLRKELRAERISYGELAEIQELRQFIDESDVELLEAAGVPEYLHNMTKLEIIDFLLAYDRYVIDFFENWTYGTPVCVEEFYDNEYQDILGENK